MRGSRMGGAQAVRVHARADAVEAAVFVEEEGGGGVQVHHRDAIRLEAFSDV